MKASKGNREYSVTEENMQHYVNEGFDIYGDDGEIVKHGKGKAVSQEEYDKLLAELEQAKKSTLSDSEVVPLLKEYAVMKGIDIGQASTAKGIYTKIRDSAPESEER
jgi:hypothetical protein